jgi:hypothetical protein
VEEEGRPERHEPAVARRIGTDTDAWAGKHVVVDSAPVDYQGKKVEVLRVRPAPAAQRAAEEEAI